MSSDVNVTVKEIDLFQTVQVQEADLLNVNTSIYNPIKIPRLAEIGDVNADNPADGSVLVYRTTNNKWNSTTTLDLQNMEGGEY